MPSFLVTSRMSPALKKRVENSLRADLRQRTLFPNRGRGRVLLRGLLMAAVLATAVFLALTYRQSRREVEARRSAILTEYRALQAGLPPGARARLLALAGVLKAPPAVLAPGFELEHLLAQPFLYVRGDARDFEPPASALEAAREASVDALATCLVSPPPNLRESTLLRSSAQAPPSARLSPFGDALHALDFFDSAFERELRTAPHMQELERLSARLERADLRRGLVALRAKVLLLAVDEPKQSGVVSDFDGEAPHDIVLRVFEIESSALLWEKRTHVDPAWISAKSRLAYSRPLDSCRLAFELRQPAPPAAARP